MSNSINLSFRHQVREANSDKFLIDDDINATIAKRNGVLDFKSLLLTAKDGTLDNAQASEQEAIRRVISNRAGAVDYLASRNIYNLTGFAPGTDAVTAANLVLGAEVKGETYPLLPPPAPNSSTLAPARVTVVSSAQSTLSAAANEAIKTAAQTLQNTYGVFETSQFPPRINAAQALNYVESGYANVAKTMVEQTYNTTGLAVLQQFADDFPSVKRLLTDDQTALKPGVVPELRALHILQEEDAAKATLLKRFAIDFEKLQPEPTGTAIAMLRRQLGGVDLPSVAEAKAIDALRTKLGNNDEAYTNLLASFPPGTTPSQLRSYWELTTPGFAAAAAPQLPQPPAPGTSLPALLNRLAADALVSQGVFNLKGFPANTTTLQAWESGDVKVVKDTPSLQGPRIEGMSGILKIRTPKAAMAQLAVPKPVDLPALVLQGFAVVDQLVQWRAELKDPSQLAQLSQQGIGREALRALSQPIPSKES